LGTVQYTLGVDRFGESGTIADLYEATGISTGNIVNAALIAVSEGQAIVSPPDTDNV
jgi:pyruvate dehydrogenase E1 component